MEKPDRVGTESFLTGMDSAIACPSEQVMKMETPLIPSIGANLKRVDVIEVYAGM